MKIIILMLALLLPATASGEELVFDQNWNLKYRVEEGRIYDKNWQPSPLTKIDPFVIVINDPQDAQLISCQL